MDMIGPLDHYFSRKAQAGNAQAGKFDDLTIPRVDLTVLITGSFGRSLEPGPGPNTVATRGKHAHGGGTASINVRRQTAPVITVKPSKDGQFRRYERVKAVAEFHSRCSRDREARRKISAKKLHQSSDSNDSGAQDLTGADGNDQ